ncbi:DNA methyltransferase [Devosia riboflavina]|uniref:Cytosine-specific methyltransferase n=1 Tax=Devosia riboflavina TaxID=46914 RepID=A0A087M3L2_9HYPH|nr:DNA cytosine methyltransferase [Devosia riboflavina]KFL31465.1 DNA methyltransferase [Devosia riboflavina]
MTIRYGSVCSGIEAATMAWHVLGWEPAFFSEIEKFPCAALAHHYPHVPNHGDMTKFQEWSDHAIDLLVGGTPCQSFSVAGLRAGLADPRGNLMLTYLAIAARYQPRWLVWENVPGVLSSNGGRDFAALLRGLGELGYGFAYRVLDAQFCRAHGYDFAVPQRRRRVFVIGYLGDWRRAAAVLFDGQSMRGDPSPRREAGQAASATTSEGVGNSRLIGGIDYEGNGHGPDDATGPLLKGSSTGGGHPLPAAAFAEPIVLMERGRGDGPNLETRQDGTANAILTPNGGRGGLGVGAVAYGIQAGALRDNPSSGPDGVGVQSDIAYTVEARAEVQAVAFAENSRGELRLQGGDGAVAPQLTTGGGKPGQGQPCVAEAWRVRRLTPRECERLQGFPDDFTAIPYRGKPAADGPRYKALGNSMAVNVMRVLGTRIAMVDALAQSQEAAA